MQEDVYKKLINDTVNMTVLKLKMAGLMRDERKSAYQKTEELLRNYKSLKESDQPYTLKVINAVDKALAELKKDCYYYQIIELIYFEGKSREYVAEYFNTTETTISRNKNKLINKLKAALFSDDFILDLFL